MSSQLISRSIDLKKLVDEGYEVEIVSGHLVIRNVPYVDDQRKVRRGKLVTTLTLAGDTTTRPGTHVVMFAGSHPCDKTGEPLREVVIGSSHQKINDELSVDHTFSRKPKDGYKDYHRLMKAYIAIIGEPAYTIDSVATARTFGVVRSGDDGVFKYTDTASSRAGITDLSGKLANHKIGIIGLGGTGSYILDLVAKTHAPEIHLFDGDKFLQHNAFRSPGAATVAALRKKSNKAEYWKARYAPMRRGIYAHDFYITAENVSCLDDLDLGFAFVCIDAAGAKQPIIEKLEELDIPFIDVGMGLMLTNGKLQGLLRVTASTPGHREHVHDKKRIGLAGGDGDGVYSHNIQIAELNQMNAALAVIRWKKWCDFYADFDFDPDPDLKSKHHSVYVLATNRIFNE